MSKNETKTGSQKIVFNLFSNISFPIKALAAVSALVGGGVGTAYLQDAIADNPVQRIETVQVADKETKEKLDKILSIVQDTREKVIENSTDIKSMKENQKEMKIRIDKNETDIERVERR